MCGPSLNEIRKSLDGEVTGSISQAALQRAEHKRLYDEVKATRAAYETARYGHDQAARRAWVAAANAWGEHIREHQRQASVIRAQREAERVK